MSHWIRCSRSARQFDSVFRIIIESWVESSQIYVLVLRIRRTELLRYDILFVYAVLDVFELIFDKICGAKIFHIQFKSKAY